MNEVKEDGYTYLGLVEIDKVREDEMKEKLTCKYNRRFSLILESEVNGRNKATAINISAVAILRYGVGIIEWREPELTVLDRKTRKTMTM